MSSAIAIINPAIKRKTDALKRNHNIFGRSFILKSRRSKIELAKEKITSKMHKKKEPILPYSYIHLKSEENLNLST